MSEIERDQKPLDSGKTGGSWVGRKNVGGNLIGGKIVLRLVLRGASSQHTEAWNQFLKLYNIVN